MLAELLHGQITLLLREVAVKRLSVVSVAYQLVGNILCLKFGAAEYYGEYPRIIVDDALQGQILVLGIDHIIYVVYVFGTLVAASHHYLLVVVQIRLGYLLYLFAHRGREKQRVALFGHPLEYLVDALCKSHVEHLVSLVEHHVLHRVEHGLAAVHQVDETSRRGYDYLRSVAQRAYLRIYRSASIYSHYVDTFHVL